MPKSLKFLLQRYGILQKKKEETGSVVNQKQSECQQFTSATENKRIATTSKRNRLVTALEITNSMNNPREDPISVTTVKRQLMEAGLGGRIATRKPVFFRPMS